MNSSLHRLEWVVKNGDETKNESERNKKSHRSSVVEPERDRKEYEPKPKVEVYRHTTQHPFAVLQAQVGRCLADVVLVRRIDYRGGRYTREHRSGGGGTRSIAAAAAAAVVVSVCLVVVQYADKETGMCRIPHDACPVEEAAHKQSSRDDVPDLRLDGVSLFHAGKDCDRELEARTARKDRD